MKKTAVSKNLQLQSLENKLLPRLHCVSYFAPLWGAGWALPGKIYVKVRMCDKKHTQGIKTIQDLCAKSNVWKYQSLQKYGGAKSEKLPIQVQSVKNCLYRCKVWVNSHPLKIYRWCGLPTLSAVHVLHKQLLFLFIYCICIMWCSHQTLTKSKPTKIWYIYMKDIYRWCVPADIACSAHAAWAKSVTRPT